MHQEPLGIMIGRVLRVARFSYHAQLIILSFHLWQLSDWFIRASLEMSKYKESLSFLPTGHS